MKESEARELTCPFMSTVATLQSIENGYSASEYEVQTVCKCMTSNCMAWKWELIRVNETKPNQNGNTFTLENSKEDGYCMRLEQK